MPQEFARHWEWWLEARGHDTLTWAELRSWSIMTKRKLTAQESEIIMRIDAICRRVISE